MGNNEKFQGESQDARRHDEHSAAHPDENSYSANNSKQPRIRRTVHSKRVKSTVVDPGVTSSLKAEDAPAPVSSQVFQQPQWPDNMSAPLPAINQPQWTKTQKMLGELPVNIEAILSRVLHAMDNSKEYKKLLNDISLSTDSEDANEKFEQLEVNNKPAFTKAGKEFQTLQQELFIELVSLRNELNNKKNLDSVRVEEIGRGISAIQDKMQDKQYRTLMGHAWHKIMEAVDAIVHKVKNIVASLKGQEPLAHTPRVYTGGYKPTLYKESLADIKGEQPEAPTSPTKKG